MRRHFKLLLAAAIAIVAFHSFVAIMLCEGTLHLRHKPISGKKRALAEGYTQQFDAHLDSVQIRSFDGARLAAWVFRPRRPNGQAVILLHGHGDNRAGVLQFAPMFLDRQFVVLLPDSRGHGESGDDVATYGLNEARDVHQWVDWLRAQGTGGCVYGLGESMGAAVLLQALPGEPRLCAVATESPYASFREVALDRLAQKFGNNSPAARLLFTPLVAEAFLYARLRYGIDLDLAAPARSVASAHVPILLIHGQNDFNIPVRHCRSILNHGAGPMDFWQVPDAGHTEAFGYAPDEFQSRVSGWFSRYSHK